MVVMVVVASISLIVFAALCVLLVLVGLPGIWIMLLGALAVDLWWQPVLLSNAALVALATLALFGEIIEFFASAVGAKRAGGSRRASAGAIAGSVVGGIVGSIFIPIPAMGTILGAALGAGALSLALELTKQPQKAHVANRAPGHAVRVGLAAFKGRLLATIIKTAIAIVAVGVMVAATVMERL